MKQRPDDAPQYRGLQSSLEEDSQQLKLAIQMAEKVTTGWRADVVSYGTHSPPGICAPISKGPGRSRRIRPSIVLREGVATVDGDPLPGDERGLR